MADGNLETSGVQLVAEGADKYVNDFNRATQAGQNFGKSTADAIAKLAGTRDVIADLEIEIKGLQGALANAARANDWEKFAQDSIKLRVAKENLAAYVKELKGLKDAAQNGAGNAATKGIEELGKASDASGKKLTLLGLSVSRLFVQIASGQASFSTISSGIGEIIRNMGALKTGATEGAAAVSALGAAGSSSGGALASGLIAAVPAILAIVAAAAAAVLAVKAIGDAIGQAVSYGSQISRLSDSTGLSGGLAQSLSGGAAISGNAVGGIANTFNAIGANAEASAERADKALGGIGASADKANTRLQRLNDDYARSIADITTGAAERIQESNDKLAESHEAMLQRQARADEDYARELEDGRASLAQRLADIDASANASIAGLTQRQTRASEDYARETENARRDLAESILDIETNLADSVEQLQYNAAERNTSAIDSGAKAQEKIQEDLQKSLYDIEQKYSSKRQSLQEKIYDPNTNPILRAFYKTQLKSLDGLQKAEEDGARSGASAKEAAARRETQALLAETARRLAREIALEQQQAQRREAILQREAQQRQAERQREFAQQSGDLAAQIAVENAQRDQQRARAIADQAARENDLRRSYERQTNDAKAAYDKQVLDAAAAQLKIQAETEKRLAAEKLQYDRAIEDINTALTNAGGGASAAAGGIDKVARGFEALGINVDEFNKLKPDEQFKLINDKIGELVASGNTDKAIKALMDITGGSREMAVQYINSVGKMDEADKLLKDLGFTDEQIEQAKKTQEGFDTVKLALGLLGAQIGAVFLPIVLDMIAAIKSGWEWFVDKFLPALRDTYNFIKDKLVGAFASLKEGAVKLWDKLEPVRKVVDAIANVAMAALDVKAREVESFWTKYLGPAFKDVGAFLEDHIAPVLKDLGGYILDDFNTKIQAAKLVFEWLYNHLGDVATFFNNIATNIGKISLPSWLQPTNGGFTPNITYPSPPSYANPYGGGVKSVPATPAQMSAGTKTTANNTNNTTATLTQNFFGKADPSKVGDETVNALFKQGFKVSR